MRQQCTRNSFTSNPGLWTGKSGQLTWVPSLPGVPKRMECVPLKYSINKGRLKVYITKGISAIEQIPQLSKLILHPPCSAVVQQCWQVCRPIKWSFYMWSGIIYTLSPVVPDHGEWGLSKDCLLRVCWSTGKRCSLGLLCDTEGRQARGRRGEESGVEGQGTQQWPLSSWEGPSVKCVFLQFEKVESGQIGVLLSSECVSHVTMGGGWGEFGGVYEWAGTALIDTFSSSERSETLSSAKQWHSRSDWLSP